MYSVYRMATTVDAPRKRIFLTAQWRDILMLNYEVEPKLIANFVPSGTEIDYWNGKTYISLVGFRFLKTRVFRIAFPFHCNFDEVNLRFYVRRRRGSELRRGVVFIREIVPRRAIAAMAQAFYGERYASFPMTHTLQSEGQKTLVDYRWKPKDEWNRVSIKAAGPPILPQNLSLEQFITEHYWGYSATNNGGCIEYEVSHPQWRVWNTEDASFDCRVEEHGPDISAVLKQPATSAFLAEGSAVIVYRGAKITL